MSHDWDELASASIDGEASADDLTRLNADPEGMAALGELRAVAEANAEVPAPPSGLRDLHLAAALDLFDQIGAQSSASATISASRPHPSAESTDASAASDARVIPLPRRRAARWIASAAAGLVVVAGIGLGLAQLGGSSNDGNESADAASSPSASNERSTDSADMAASDTGETEAEMATALKDLEGGADSDAAADDSTQEVTTEAGDEAMAASPTTAAAGQPFDQDLEPVVDLSSADNLFAAAERLIGDDLMSADPATPTGQQLANLRTRCPRAFDEFDSPLAAPVLFNGESATLVISSAPMEHVMLITRDCSILAADQRS